MLGLNLEQLSREIEDRELFQTVGKLRSANGLISCTLPAAIGDHKVGSSQLILFVVECGQSLAGTGRAYPNELAPEFGAVECMHRLRQFGHDEIGQVDDIVDRVESDRLQPILQP